MELFATSALLKKQFNLSAGTSDFGEGVTSTICTFSSDFDFSPIRPDAPLSQEELNILTENGKDGNFTFRYPVFYDSQLKGKNNKAILLLHGLNERSWEKYLSWAYFLVKHTGRSVIMFPIAFHMNRTPQKWGNARLMHSLSDYRRRNKNVQNTSFANLALSLRMEYTPQMFPISGTQTYFDLVKLCTEIKEGRHELFEANTSVNIFAYSIGALLAEILLIANPASLFSGERAFLFCGGASVDKMNPNSKSIIDSEATRQLNEFLKCNYKVSDLMRIPEQNMPLLPKAWDSFRYLSCGDCCTRERDLALAGIKGQIKTLGLGFDSVISPRAIEETLHSNFSILSPRYPGSHENPFPFLKDEQGREVENTFNTIFSEASEFLA